MVWYWYYLVVCGFVGVVDYVFLCVFLFKVFDLSGLVVWRGYVDIVCIVVVEKYGYGMVFYEIRLLCMIR